jgi:hypothetical protein
MWNLDEDIENIFKYNLNGVIAQNVGWVKANPIHGMVMTVGESTHYHLR